MSDRSVMMIFAYRPTSIEKVYLWLKDRAGSTIYVWGRKGNQCGETLSFPKSSLIVEFVSQAQKDLSEYFRHDDNNFVDDVIQDYYRKIYSLGISDFYAFMHASLQHVGRKEYKVIGAGLLKNIYGRKHTRRRFVVYYYLFGTLAVLYLTTKAAFVCLITTKKVRAHEVIFLRKKAYPDLGIKDALFEQLEQYGVYGQGCLLGFSAQYSAFGFFYLNAFAGSFMRSIRSGVHLLGGLGIHSRIAVRYAIPMHDYIKALTNSYRMITIANLGAKVYVGILHDEPIFVMLDKYKHNGQKLLSLNESFLYPPFLLAGDYCRVDVYYSMNKIDEDSLNRNGGHIGEFRRVGFFRKQSNLTSNGISHDLRGRFHFYHKIVLVPLCQISESVGVHIYLGKEELDRFLSSVIALAKEFSDTLFIVKEKKGELDYADKDLLRKCKKCRNIYTVVSKKPRHLLYNQFENLLPHADLLISMNLGSTTIWQALSNGVPAIAVNDIHPSSFLRSYPYVEVSLLELSAAVKYWLSVDISKKNQLLNNLADDVNLDSSEGMRKIAEDIAYNRL